MKKPTRLIALILTLTIVLSIMPATAMETEGSQPYTYATLEVAETTETTLTSDTSEALFSEYTGETETLCESPSYLPELSIAATAINTANRPFRCGDVKQT